MKSKRTIYDHINLLSRGDRTTGLLNTLPHAIKEGDLVFDAGCGSGVLSLLAVKNGASKVIGVDLGPVEIAEELAEENGFSEKISFIQEKLEKVHLKEYQNKFDVIMGMIYYNDPRRDEKQQQIIFDLKKKYLKPGGKMLPDHVTYNCFGCGWPSYDIKERKGFIKKEIEHLEKAYQLSFKKTFTKYVQNQIDENFFPIKDHIKEGKLIYSKNPFDMLSKPTLFCNVNYNTDSFKYPNEFSVKISSPGKMNSIMWVQELWFQDVLIFSTESISYIDNPKMVKLGDKVTIRLGDNWRKTNIAKIM